MQTPNTGSDREDGYADDGNRSLAMVSPPGSCGSGTPSGGRSGPSPRRSRPTSATCAASALPVHRPRWGSMTRAGRCCPTFQVTSRASRYPPKPQARTCSLHWRASSASYTTPRRAGHLRRMPCGAFSGPARMCHRPLTAALSWSVIVTTVPGTWSSGAACPPPSSTSTWPGRRPGSTTSPTPSTGGLPCMPRKTGHRPSWAPTFRAERPSSPRPTACQPNNAATSSRWPAG
jgi:hypothetical protein